MVINLNYKVAVVVRESSIGGMMSKAISASDAGANLIEFRLDYLRENYHEEEAIRVMLQCVPGIPLIVTNRHKKEVGKDEKAGFKGSEELRLSLLQRAVTSENVRYVDIEHNYYHYLLINEKKIGSNVIDRPELIVSYYNFDSTPSDEELERIYKSITRRGKGVIPKIVTTAQTPEDANRILDFIKRHAPERERGLVALAMGELGKKTRIYGPLYGSLITYASLKGKATAPGQLDIFELKKEIEKAREELSKSTYISER